MSDSWLAHNSPHRPDDRTQTHEEGRESPPVDGIVEHLFRREYGRMVSRLVGILGPAQLSLAEEVVQEALLAALQTWPFRGVPEQPRAWLVQVARNRALDRLRRTQAFQRQADEVRRQIEEFSTPGSRPVEDAGDAVSDDQLRMMFLCCQPDLPPATTVPLILKTVCGFGVSEIAHVLLSRPETIAQRLVRAKRRLRSEGVRFEMPPARELDSRLESVLASLYLMFTEGYWPQEGDLLIREDMLRESIRLTSALAGNRVTAAPQVHALLALMLFLAARIPARFEGGGELLLLADQDRSLWDRELIVQAFAHLDRSIAGRHQTPYHLQAAIAARHASAPGSDSTDWEEILRLYDLLLEIQPSPIVRLNRCVALSFVRGPEAGLECLRPLRQEPALKRYHLLPAAQGALSLKLGRRREAAAFYREALRRPCGEVERRFLKSRLQHCR